METNIVPSEICNILVEFFSHRLLLESRVVFVEDNQPLTTFLDWNVRLVSFSFTRLLLSVYRRTCSSHTVAMYVTNKCKNVS